MNITQPSKTTDDSHITYNFVVSVFERFKKQYPLGLHPEESQKLRIRAIAGNLKEHRKGNL